TRRDLCYLLGRRGSRFNLLQSAEAWGILCRQLEALGEKDVPKWMDVMVAINVARISAKRRHPVGKRQKEFAPVTGLL
ncbi:MAG TPA: hypothetical protein VNM37_22990, partial [Candidatus Dormibacteraeota bacterium]|nr:hypothetical protein [Candidatus Dormibacteraeota bacterium]